jgi:hypothetical protein
MLSISFFASDSVICFYISTTVDGALLRGRRPSILQQTLIRPAANRVYVKPSRYRRFEVGRKVDILRLFGLVFGFLSH